MTDAALLDELTNDPAGLGYAGKMAAEKVALLNAPKAGVTFPVMVPVANVLQILGSAPFRAAALPEPGRTGWLESLANIRALQVGLFPSDPGVSALFTQAVAAGVVTAEEKAQLDALGVRMGSRAEEIFGEGTIISLNDVARVS